MRNLLLIILCYMQSSICFAQLKFDKMTRHDSVPSATTQYSFAFSFKNIGSVPIKILSIETTCGCTIATTNKTLILPNDTGNIKGTLKISDTDSQTKNIIVNTDYLPQKSINLSLNINKTELLKIFPKLLFWEKGLTPSKKIVTIKLLSRNISIAEISYDTKLIKVEQEKKNTLDEFILNIVPLKLNKVLRSRICIYIKDNLDKSIKQYYIHVLVK